LKSNDKILRELVRERLRKELSGDIKSTVKTNLDISCHTADSKKTTGSKLSQKTALDIWHPDFWATENPGAVKEAAGGSSTINSRSSDGRSSTFGGSSDGKKTDYFDGLPSLDEVKQIDSSEDDDSVLSDLSGLTGIFSDFAPERTSKKDNVKAALKIDPSAKIGNLSSKVHKKERATSVRFSDVTIREYERIIGDNPACTNGPSVSIGWKYMERSVILNEFEKTCKTRRRLRQLTLTRKQREEILKSWGFTSTQISDATRQGNKARLQRRQTTNNLGSQKMEEALQNAARTMKQLMFLK
jgi:hypothetical protein